MIRISDRNKGRLVAAAVAVGCVLPSVLILALYNPSIKPPLRDAILSSDSAYYQLGRNAGALAYATLETNRRLTGHTFSTDEVLDLADSLSGFRKHIETARSILEDFQR